MLRRLRAWKTRRQLSKREHLALEINALEREVREEQKSLVPQMRMITSSSSAQETLMWNTEKLKKKKALLAALDRKLKI